MATASNIEIPIWLILFVIAGMLLFALKVLSDETAPEAKKGWSGSLRLFLAIAMALLTIAGIVDFVVWVRPS